MLQPRGGSDARADFAEQVAVHVDFRLPSSSGGDSGPERRPKAGASTLSSPEAPLAARGASKDFVDTVLLGISNLCVLWL